MGSIQVLRINDACLFGTKYEIWLNGHYYTSNISKILKDKYVSKFKELGYSIVGVRQED